MDRTMYNIGENGPGFSFAANSSLIGDILDACATRNATPRCSGNMFEETEVQRKRNRSRWTKQRQEQQKNREQLNLALERIVDTSTVKQRASDAGSSSYDRIGSNVMELHVRRARDARLSSPWVTTTLSLSGNIAVRLLHEFRRSCLNRTPVDINAFTMSKFLMFCADRANHRQSDDESTTLPTALQQSLTLTQMLDSSRANILFDQNEHVYYHVDVGQIARGGQQAPTTRREAYAMSVTKSLDLLFGEFDADSVARRIIQSQRWKSNALYKELAFDTVGRPRAENEVIAMLKKRWNDSRDKGTELHAYIQSLSRDHDRFSLATTTPTATTTTTNATHVPRTSFQFATGDRSNELKVSVELSSPSSQDRTIEESERANTLWAKLRALAATSGNRTMVARSPADDRAIKALHIDASNLAAFERFNRRRLDDGWLLLANEYIVYDRLASLAGSIDAIYVPYIEHPNLVVLVDWKRCDIDLGTRYSPFIPGMRNTNAYSMRYPKCNYWKYAMQLNVYRELLERMMNRRLVVIDMLIVSLPPDVHEPRIFSVPRLADAQLFIADLRDLATSGTSPLSLSVAGGGAVCKF